MANLMSTGDVDISYVGVENVISIVTACYQELQKKIENMNTQKKEIPEYWQSTEASNFVEKMDTVSKYFEDFCTHYEMFIALLNKVLDLYDQEEESILASLQKYQSAKQG